MLPFFTTFEDMTDTTGRVKRSEIHSDLWQLTITHANFAGATVEADIYPGDKEKVLVKLKPLNLMILGFCDLVGGA